MGAYLSEPKKSKHIEKGETKLFKWASASMQGWRLKMEDAHIAATNIGGTNINVFGVFDGHGGEEVAQVTVKYFIGFLQKNTNYQKNNYQQALYETFMEIDKFLQSPKGVQELNKIIPQNSGQQAGATANVCLITPTEIYCANAGDSRTLLTKEIVEMSYDHKPNNKEEMQRISKAGGYGTHFISVTNGRVNGNLNLSRALGDFEYKGNKKLSPEQQIISCAPDIKKRNLIKSDQFILMGCDGIWESLSNQQICDFIQKRLDQKMNLETILTEFLDQNLAPDTSSTFIIQWELDVTICLRYQLFLINLNQRIEIFMFLLFLNSIFLIFQFIPIIRKYEQLFLCKVYLLSY